MQLDQGLGPFARSARCFHRTISRTCAVMVLSRASTARGAGPRFFVAPANSPRSRAARHTARCDEYRPSRRSSAPPRPASYTRPSSRTIRRLYSRVKRRAPAGTLSGGQQQILEMAIALLLHPRLLLVDEPSLGLDPRMVEAVFSTIVKINREGTAVLMVEQNAKQALAISGRGFVLELGRNRFEGTGRALLDDPEVRAHYLGG